MVLYCFQSFPGIHEIQLKHHASFVNDSEKSAATPSTPFISHAHSSPGYPPVSVIVSWKLVASQMQNSTSKKFVILVTRMQQQSQIRGEKNSGNYAALLFPFKFTQYRHMHPSQAIQSRTLFFPPSSLFSAPVPPGRLVGLELPVEDATHKDLPVLPFFPIESRPSRG